MNKSGKDAYIEDVKSKPNYHDGTPRKPWDELCDVAQQSWIRNPTTRGKKQ